MEPRRISRPSHRLGLHRAEAHGLDTRVLLAQARGASKAHDIGFRFCPAVAYPAASFTFTWSAAKGGVAGVDGRRGGGHHRRRRLAPATVVIQHTTVRTSRFLEYGKPPPFAESTGSGTALVLRKGKEWQAHWSRQPRVAIPPSPPRPASR